MSLNVLSVELSPNPVSTDEHFIIRVNVEECTHERLEDYTHAQLTEYTHEELAESILK